MRSTRRIAIGNGVSMITEIRKEPEVFPEIFRGRRLAGPFLLVLAVALFNVWLSGQYYRIGYAVSSAVEEKQNLRREKDLLRTEILSLRSPSRIESIAKAELGLVEPKTDRMIRVK